MAKKPTPKRMPDPPPDPPPEPDDEMEEDDDECVSIEISLPQESVDMIESMMSSYHARKMLAELAYALREDGLTDHADKADAIIDELNKEKRA